MAHRPPCLFLLLAALAACSSDASSQRGAATGAPQLAAAEQLRIPLDGPVFIDSSAYVMYPLSLGEIETEGSSDDSSIKYSRASTPFYWNILFYNLKSGQSHLLGKQKMVIHSYSGQETSNSSEASDAGYPRVYAAKELLYFAVTTVDFNHDGQLTSEDPSYLFISAKDGNHFRQISPDSLHVTGWEIHQGTGKILLQTVQDSNHDRKFGAGDENIPYVYDIATQQPARRLFSPAFMQQLRTQFRRQWPKKP